jgi:predicted amidohydrolase YtcJ
VTLRTSELEMTYRRGPGCLIRVPTAGEDMFVYQGSKLKRASIASCAALIAAFALAFVSFAQVPQAPGARGAGGPPGGPPGGQAPTTPADLILTGGKVYTPAGWAEAMAIQRGVIIAVGNAASVSALRGAQTQVIELRGAAVLPGLHDMHVHPGSGGNQGCSFPQGSSLKVVQETLAKCVAARGEGEWITGGQWDAASIGSPPHRSMLDAVSPKNPVVLTDISGHSRWANTRALELSNVTAQTKDPAGGAIERDASGAPTGVMRESAGSLIRARVAPPAPGQALANLKSSLDLMLSHGVTSFTDAVASEGSLSSYATLADQGQLKQRVRACLSWRPTGATFDANTPTGPLARANLYARDRVLPDCVKVMLDGVPTDGHTAAMLDPYADSLADAGRERGLLQIPQATLNATLVALDAWGFTVKMHAAGDAAVRAGLDAIAAARKANGFSGRLHNVAHNSFVSKEDIKRARDIGAVFEMSPYIWYPNAIIPDIAKAIGPERMKRWIPVKDAIDSGALVIPGSDWPVVPEVNPWIGIETLVTRQKLGGGGERLGDPITLKQAIDIFTVNAARQMGNANRTGRITPGLLADVIVLDRNPFDVPITEVHKTRVTMALVNGEIVYGKAP